MKKLNLLLSILVFPICSFSMSQKELNYWLLLKSCHGEYDLVFKYLREGADVNVRDEHNMTPLMLACMAGTKRHYKTLELLLENGADVYLKDYAGDAALMFAVQTKNAELVNLLLKWGASATINFQDRNGDTALMKAVSSYNLDNNIINTLLEHGADKNLTNNEHKTAYDLALRRINWGWAHLGNVLQKLMPHNRTA